MLMQTEQQLLTKTKTVIATLSLLGLAIALLYPSYSQQTASAQSTSGLESKIAQLEQEIANSEKQSEQLEGQAELLEDAIAELNGEINNIQKQIDLTELKIEQIEQKLKETREELEQQKLILATSLREHYKIGNLTTIELFVNSENFSDFFNQKEYLNRVRSSIQASSQKVAALEQDLEDQEAEQNQLLDQQQAQRNEVVLAKRDKDTLLSETRGQQAAYEQLTARLTEQRKEAERELAAKLAAGNFVSLGPIAKGDVIGTIGSTGFSSGPHLHLEVRTPNAIVTNPNNWFAQGWLVPVDPAVITQAYGVPSSLYISGRHPGIDYGIAGLPVKAIAAGNVIHRGCSQDSAFFGGTPAYGYSVIIQHNNGYFSVYGHMNPPSGGFEQCSGSYGF